MDWKRCPFRRRPERCLSRPRARGVWGVVSAILETRPSVIYRSQMIEVRQTPIFRKWLGDLADRRAAESLEELLNDAFASGDAGYVSHALGVIARARGMTEVARGAGVTREALNKALSENGDPRLTTLLGVARALGVTLTAHVETTS